MNDEQLDGIGGLREPHEINLLGVEETLCLLLSEEPHPRIMPVTARPDTPARWATSGRTQAETPKGPRTTARLVLDVWDGD